jgi:SsrA-binding protein
MGNRSKNSSEIANNKKGIFDYEIQEEYEAGVELFGWEVRSMRQKWAQLKGSHVSIHRWIAKILGMHVSPYKFAKDADVGVKRERKLFLRKNTMLRLEQKANEQGMAIIPTRVYFKWNLVKVSVALAKGRKKYDKRELIKKRDQERTLAKELGKGGY